MKVLIYSLTFFLTLSLSAMSQDLEKPKIGATLKVEDSNVTIKPNEPKSIDVWLVKSTKDSQRKFDELILTGNQSISYEIEQTEVTKEYEKYKLTLTSSATSGKYAMILKGEGKNGHKVRATILMVQVSENEAEVASN